MEREWGVAGIPLSSCVVAGEPSGQLGKGINVWLEVEASAASTIAGVCMLNFFCSTITALCCFLPTGTSTKSNCMNPSNDDM